MNADEQALHYPFGDTLPQRGQALPVAEGLRWIRMALPFALDHINLWLLRDAFEGREGWTVVDCCIDHEASRADWTSLFDSALDGLPIVRVLVTHMHPDHIGLAHWLCERWKAPLWISATDYHVARSNTRASSGNGGAAAAAFFAQHGLRDPQVMAEIGGRTDYYRNLVPDLPPRFRRLMDGDIVRVGQRNWRCVAGYGHAPEHMALLSEDESLLISGDMLLPRISTNVSVYEIEPQANPLQAFLNSIDRYAGLSPQALILPSHGRPFMGAAERVRQLHAHHAERLADVLAACRVRPQTAADVLPILFRRPLDLHQTTFAMGEAIAHLHALWFGGQIHRALSDDGVYEFGV